MNFEFQLFPIAASEIAPKIDLLFWFITAVSAFFTILIVILIAVFISKYRKSKIGPRGDDLTDAQARRLEVTWTLIPLFLGLVMFFWSAALYQDLFTPPPNSSDVWVVGKQWMWKIQHPNGAREINELHVPTGRPVRLIMTSQDVIHSFFVPAFRTKMDVLPNRFTLSWFTPTKPGKYHLFCTEYCGTKHSKMIGSVYVMKPQDYERWLAGGAGSGTLIERGAQQFTRLGCVTCHMSGPTQKGPSLNGLMNSNVKLAGGRTIKADETYIRESIIDPNAKTVEGYQPGIMPTFKNQVTEEQVIELIAYIKSLGASK
jgi:cytochrome c oxidase subunit II